jgi:hypothetical protein
MRKQGALSLTLKTGVSFADAVYAKVAARRAGSAMPRIVEETGRERREESTAQKVEKGDLI